MEPIGAVSEGEWHSSLSGMCIAEESDFLAQFLTNSSVSNDLTGTGNLQFSSSPWPVHSMNMVSSIDEACSSNHLRFTHGGSHFLNGNYMLMDSQPSIMMSNDNSISIDLCLKNLSSTDSYYRDGDDRLLQTIIQSNIHEKKNLKSTVPGIIENSKKRYLCSDNVLKTRNMRSKKNPKTICSSRNNEEDGNGGYNAQSTSSYNSGDDSYASQESIPPKCLNLIGKTRVDRGSATDPQSIYARKRERINEKLRTLQTLVPSGTKVDISTMLEEAVLYVKFLQLQIKLLSSDDLWMYAPIAYNGMDIGLSTRQS